MTEFSPPTFQLVEHQHDKSGSAAVADGGRGIMDEGRLPAGEVGEIVHRSPHAMLGYYNDEAKTTEAFRNGWFHSGDLGLLDAEGRLSVVDRKKDMIKTGGENVARESSAACSHPGVSEAAVLGCPTSAGASR
jgi:fatty-acyl-CoA synthase